MPQPAESSAVLRTIREGKGDGGAAPGIVKGRLEAVFGEVAADRYSLVHVNEPDGLAKALVKTIEYRAATPSKLEETLFYDHPAVGNRVRMAMDWKAAQMKVDAVR